VKIKKRRIMIEKIVEKCGEKNKWRIYEGGW
jgi:hypothetical protein